MNHDFTAPSLQLGDLTISSRNGETDIPSFVAGVGLGSAKVGPASSIDRLIYFPAGSGNPILEEKEGIKITCTTKISSVTIRPLFAILGSNDGTKIQFPMRFHLAGTGQAEIDQYETLRPENPAPVILAFKQNALPTEITMDVSGDTTFSAYFAGYLQARNFPAIGFLVGFSILSIQTLPPAPTNMRANS